MKAAGVKNRKKGAIFTNLCMNVQAREKTMWLVRDKVQYGFS